MTSSTHTIQQTHLDAARDAIIGVDAGQLPRDIALLNERLSIPHPGVTEALELIQTTADAKHLLKALPLVYTVLESANRAFPDEMREGIRAKSFVASIAAVGGEARAVLSDAGQSSSPTRDKQPVLASFLDGALVTEGALPTTMSLDEKIGLVALSLGTLRAVDRQLAGVEKPAVAAKLPGRNDPCHCGSGKKFKKCHALETGASK